MSEQNLVYQGCFQYLAFNADCQTTLTQLSICYTEYLILITIFEGWVNSTWVLNFDKKAVVRIDPAIAWKTVLKPGPPPDARTCFPLHPPAR